MRVIPPLTITDAMLTSSTVSEPSGTEATWNSATTYALGAQAILTSTHRIYESQQASNTNHNPATDDGTWWVDIGPTNKWAMFDLERSTGTSGTSPLTVVLTPGERIDSLALVGLDADSVTIGVTVSAVSVYSYSLNLSTREVFDWYDYFFQPFSSRSAVALFDLPPYVNGVITITITKSSGSPSCGGVIIGRSAYLGATQHGAEADATNFSRIERDDLGVATLVKRRSVPKTIQNTRIDKGRANAVLKIRDDLNATPALWSGLDDQDSGYFEPLLILGIYKRFTINMDQPSEAILALELEEI